MKAPAILLPKEPLPDLHEPPIHMESYQKGFRDGFQDGFAAADLSTPGVVLCGSGLLALLIACIVVMRHASRVVNILPTLSGGHAPKTRFPKAGRACSAVVALRLSDRLRHQTGRSRQSRARAAGCRQCSGSRRQRRQGNGEVRTS